jgi:hypothetical protein
MFSTFKDLGSLILYNILQFVMLLKYITKNNSITVNILRWFYLGKTHNLMSSYLNLSSIFNFFVLFSVKFFFEFKIAVEILNFSKWKHPYTRSQI